jgi:hypothetical protein
MKCMTLHAKEYAMFEDQELHESIQAFRAIGAEIELEPILAFLAATRARTARDGSARTAAAANCARPKPEPVTPTLQPLFEALSIQTIQKRWEATSAGYGGHLA